MAWRKHKLIGEVVALSGTFVGTYIVKIYRYPNGRVLPETRILIEHGKPFTSKLAAADMLNAYARGDIIVGKAKAAPAPRPVAAPSTNALHVEPNHALDHEGEKRIRRLRAKREIEARRKAREALPVVAKLLPEAGPRNIVRRDAQSLAIDALVASGKVKVTRCPEAARQWDSKWDVPKR